MTAGFPESYEETFASGPGRVQTVDEILATKGLNTLGSFAYNNAAPHLLSAILAQATGQSVLDYARAKLFDPLGISTRPAAEPIAQPSNVATYEAAAFAWPTDADGLHLGSAFLKLTPADMLKLGQLYLDKGRWNGAQLVSSAWIADATAEHTTTDNFGPDGGYGFHWWRVEVDGEPAFVAAGLGGNLIEVVPGKSLVVVVATESHFDPVTGGGSGDCCDPRAMVQMVSAAIVPNL
jgi:CubicO group peptidase (beta-lactamase class C family)